MTAPTLRALVFAIAIAAGCTTAFGQGRPDSKALLTAQREAMAAFAFMDGVWRGDAWTLLPSGEKHVLVQTERVGSMLGGTLRVIEGRGYEAGGTLSFNAFAVLSFDTATRRFSMRSYAMGLAGDFAIETTGDGFRWEIPAGPATIRYVAVIKDGIWTEVGDRIVPGKEPARFFEMKLARVGDTDWPAGGAIAPR